MAKRPIGKHAAQGSSKGKPAPAPAPLLSSNDNRATTVNPVIPAAPRGKTENPYFSSAVDVVKRNEKTSADDPQKKKRTRKVILIIIGIILGIYLIGVAIFSFMFMPNTKLNGTDISSKSVADVAAAVNTDVAGFESVVKGNDFNLDVRGSDISLVVDAQAYAQEADARTYPFAWPFQVFQSHDLELERRGTFDEQKLASMVKTAVEDTNSRGTDPKDATVGFSDAAGKFVVIDEVYGTKLDEAKTLKFITQHIQSLQSEITIDDSECCVQPSILKDDKRLADAASAANVYVDNTIPLRLANQEVAQVKPENIKDWVTLDDQYNVTFDESLVTAWCQGALSDELDTVGTTRTYTRGDGAQVTVEPGTYGWSIDGEALAPTIIERVNAHSSDPIDVPTTQEGAVWAPKGQADWGNTYIDVDLGEQHAYYYKNGALAWESDVVTGSTAQGHATPAGAYYVRAKQTSVTLTGQIQADTGEPEYTSYVKYWMPFRGNAWGLHDASWRSSFGGSIYVYNGSHGCINLPSSAAAELYDIVEVGCPVLVH